MWQFIKGENGKLVFNINTDILLDKLGSLIEVVLGKSIRVIIVIILIYFIIMFGNKVINKFVENQSKSNRSFTINKQKAMTVGAILKSTIKYFAYGVGAVMIIGNIFPVSATVLSAIGFVVGIGSQSLVKDLINGFFILFEDQFAVGDYVTISSFTGIVENMGIRTTMIKDFDGNVHILQNGNITQITNHSKGNIRFIVNIEILYKEDVEKALYIIKQVCKEFEKENKDNLIGQLDIQGITDVSYDGIIFKVIGKGKPLMQSTLEKNLKVNIKLALYENEIEMPYSKYKKIIEEKM